MGLIWVDFQCQCGDRSKGFHNVRNTKGHIIPQHPVLTSEAETKPRISKQIDRTDALLGGFNAGDATELPLHEPTGEKTRKTYDFTSKLKDFIGSFIEVISYKDKLYTWKGDSLAFSKVCYWQKYQKVIIMPFVDL